MQPTIRSADILKPARSLVSNLILLGTSAALLVVSLELIQTRATSVISRDAVINGVLVDVRAVETGTLKALAVESGEEISAQTEIGQIENQRVSELPLRTLNSELGEQQSALRQAKAQLRKQEQLKQQLEVEYESQEALYNSQKSLVAAEVSHSIREAQAELKGAQSERALAQKEYERQADLVAQNVVPQVNLEQAQLQLTENLSDIEQIEAGIASLKARQAVVQQELSLVRSRNSVGPSVRLDQLALDITEQREEVALLAQNIQNKTEEIKAAEKDLQQQQLAPLESPVDGIVWQLNARQGQYVEAGDLLAQMLDCDRRWVDVYVDERALRSIEPGMAATVELHGSRGETIPGRVSLVRSGVGRLMAGEEAAIPASSNLPRQSQVRVELDSSGSSANQSNFCQVGYTGRVTFHVS